MHLQPYGVMRSSVWGVSGLCSALWMVLKG